MPPKTRYASLTWPEVKQAAAEDRLIILPVGMTEDHGPHLPLDTDIVLTYEVCCRVADRMAGEVLLAPPVNHGYSPHHMDFPGSLTVDGHALIDYLLGIGQSLVHHGFKHILLVNGHGSNAPFVDVAARLTVVRTEGRCLCAGLSYWGLGKVQAVAKEVLAPGEPLPGHAGEFETSMYLAINPAAVDMSKAVVDGEAGTSEWLMAPGNDAVAYMPFWSGASRYGVKGDSRRATPEKGEKLLDAAVEGLVDLARRFRQAPVPQRVDHH